MDSETDTTPEEESTDVEVYDLLDNIFVNTLSFNNFALKEFMRAREEVGTIGDGAAVTLAMLRAFRLGFEMFHDKEIDLKVALNTPDKSVIIDLQETKDHEG